MRALSCLALVVLGAWSTGAVALSPYANEPVRLVLALAFAVALVATFGVVRRRRGFAVGTVATMAACAVPLLAAALLLRPSNDRDWTVDQLRLPRVERAGDVATVREVRDFRYRGTTDYDAAWEDRRYDLAQVESAWFVVEPFSSFAGAAHTFLSFGFANGDYLAVSVEIRKEKGESFSALKGLYRNYELMYVLGDERDLVALRTTYRRDVVYLYPLRVSKAGMRAMLEDVFARVNALAAEPQFYDSLTNTCTTNIAAIANDVKPGVVPFSWQLVLPGYSDERALALGLIDFDGTIDAARARFRINERADAAAGAPDFSRRIRDPGDAGPGLRSP